ncbi:MAG: hypothetical protein FJ100_05790 [Deltaproteobacteria bacterium]|nr:hypothetical protein [Deltaproteobacteria bacterium]
MTSAHVFYIPALLVAGIAIGIAVGRKLLLAEQEANRRRAERLRALDPPNA